MEAIISFFKRDANSIPKFLRDTDIDHELWNKMLREAKTEQ